MKNNRKCGSKSSKDHATLGHDASDGNLSNLLQCGNINQEVRRCAHCRVNLSISEFPLNRDGKRRYQCRTCFYKYLSKRNRNRQQHSWKDSERELTVTRCIDESKPSTAVEVLIENMKTLGYLKKSGMRIDPLKLLKTDHSIISLIGRKK